MSSAFIHNGQKYWIERFNILKWIFQSTTVQGMSSSAPVVTNVSTPTTDVMESLIAVTAQMSKPVVSI